MQIFSIAVQMMVRIKTLISLRLISAALYVRRYSVFNHMRVLSPDACGATRRYQRIHACAECHGPECSNDHKGRGLCNIANEHPLALRTECSTTPKWRSVIPSAYMHVSAFTPHQCSNIIYINNTALYI